MMPNFNKNNTQLEHHNTINNKISTQLTVVADQLRTPENIGMLFRTSEAFGTDSVYICGDSPNLQNKKVVRTARSAQKNLKIKYFETTLSAVQELIREQYLVVALEITSESKAIQQFDFSPYSKIALIIGAERDGIQAEILQQVHHSVHIPMFGKNSSINVINALSAALFEITRHNNL